MSGRPQKGQKAAERNAEGRRTKEHEEKEKRRREEEKRRRRGGEEDEKLKMKRKAGKG